MLTANRNGLGMVDNAILLISLLSSRPYENGCYIRRKPIMQCSSCRTQLSPEMTTCAFCGSPVSADPPETAESSPYETAVPYIPWQHTSPAAALQPTTPQPFSAWQQPHLIQHEAPRRSLSTGIIVLIIILILLTLGGSGLTYFVVAVRLPGESCRVLSVSQDSYGETALSLIAL
jgi:hypothetical protein